MRVRIHMESGAVIDAEEFSPDNGASWSAIEVPHVVAAMRADTGFTVVRDLFAGEWRALRNARIESIGPAPDLDAAVEAEVERRIGRVLAERLPTRVAAAAPVIEHPHGPADPTPGRGQDNRGGQQ